MHQGEVVTDAAEAGLADQGASGANRRDFADRANLLRPLLLLVADGIGLLVAFIAGLLLAAGVRTLVTAPDLATPWDEFVTGNRLEFAVLAMALLVWLNHRGHHNLRLPLWIEARQLVAGCLVMLLVDGFLQFALKAAPSRLWLVQSWIVAPAVLLAGRWLARRALAAAGLWQLPTLIVAGAERGRELATLLACHRALGYQVVQTLDFAEAAALLPWRDCCRRLGARFVLIAAPDQQLAGYRRMTDGLMAEGVPYAIAPEMSGLPVTGVDWHAFPGGESVLLVPRDTLFRPASRVLKVVFDTVLASLLAVMLLPLFGVFAAIIRWNGAPVLYAHSRVGLGGRPFRAYKFRTMVPDADRVLAALLAADPAARAEWQTYCKLRDDPRVTRFGRFLRAYSLDELPQLFNVLAGQMSLVGPRPIAPAEIERFGDDIRFYHSIRPGITGLWQVSGRNDTDYDERVRLNNWYVKNWSVWLDILILIKTIPVVLGRGGAY